MATVAHRVCPTCKQAVQKVIRAVKLTWQCPACPVRMGWYLEYVDGETTSSDAKIAVQTSLPDSVICLCGHEIERTEVEGRWDDLEAL